MPGGDAQRLLGAALEQHQRGNLAAAEPLYRQVLRAVPNNFDALHYLGVLCAQKGDNEEAVKLIGKALTLNSSSPAAYSNHGNALRDLKRYKEALASYDRAIALNPQYANAFYNRGNTLQVLKRPREALVSYDRAIALNGNFPEAFCMRGSALRDLKRPEEALASYDRAIALRPVYPDAFYGKAGAQRDLQRFADALASCERAIALKPDFVEAIVNRGNALFSLKRSQDALEAYDQALALDPNSVEALIARSVALRDLKRKDEARIAVDAAIAAKPDSIEALCARAALLKDDEKYAEAHADCDRALEINPESAEAFWHKGRIYEDERKLEEAAAEYDKAVARHLEEADLYYHRGRVLQVLKKPEAALASFDKAIALKPDFAEAVDERGLALQDLDKIDEAVESYTRAIAMKPDLKDAFNHRGNLMMEHQHFAESAADFEQLLKLDPAFDYARGNFLHTRMHCCDWRDYDEILGKVIDELRAGKHVVTPFPFQAMSGEPADLRKCSEIFAGDVYAAKTPALWTGERYGHDKIRIGYVAGEFREQATSYLTVGMFEHHDKSRFEIYALDNGKNDGGPTRKRLEAAFDAFVDIGKLTDAEAAAEIRRREIDILVDLNGFFGLERTGIFAHRPAPLQVNYLGFPATLGICYFDYIIADPIVIPRDEEQHYVEKVVWLPDSYQSNDDKRKIGDATPTRAQAGLPDGAFVFCCFNNSYKFTPEMYDVWMRILGQVENSVLWILESNDALIPNLRKEAEARGISGERIRFAPFCKLDEHLARQRLGDLFIDSLPYNAHTTASDALWAGLPVVTCRGTAFPGRVATSLLSALGMPELITENLADYEALAVSLAKDKAKLAAIRAKLDQNRRSKPLFNTARFTWHIEAAFTTMQQRLADDLSPESFAVEPHD
jgi:predicted O-linked N-acetylglucosamine transferase (SPINDLY family)